MRLDDRSGHVARVGRPHDPHRAAATFDDRAPSGDADEVVEMSQSEIGPDRARAELYHIMQQDLEVEDKIERALDLGRAYLGVENAHLTRIDDRIDLWEAIASTDPPDGVVPPGLLLDLANTYCRRVVSDGSTIAHHDVETAGWVEDPAYRMHELRCYHGTPLHVEDEIFGTLCFVATDARRNPFTEQETLFVELMARMLEHEIQTIRQAGEIDLQANLINVLSRVLRHNLRNDLGVIRGQLSRMTDDGPDPYLSNEQAIVKIDKLIDLAETARQIESIASSDLDRQPVELAELVDHVVRKVTREYRSASIQIDSPDDVYINAIPTLRTALDELITNAAKHAGDDASVRIKIHPREERVEIHVIDDGPGLPVQEQRVLREGAESPLVHGSGLGLWLTYWIVSNHDGTITTDVSESGTRITVGLPRRSSVADFVDSESLLAKFHREQDRYEAVFEESFDAIIVFDDDGRCIECNRRAADLLDVSRKDLIGQPFARFLGRNTVGDTAWRDLIGSEPEGDTLTVVRQDGSRRIVEYTAAPEIIPGQHVAVFRDVTEKRARTQDLREARERLQMALEATGTVVFEWPIDGDTVIWTTELEELVGLSPGGFRGTYQDFAKRVHDDDLEAVESTVHAAIASGEPYEVQFRLRHEDGHYLTVEAHGKLVDVRETPTVTGIVIDVTDRSDR